MEHLDYTKMDKETFNSLYMNLYHAGVTIVNDENRTWDTVNQCHMADPMQHERALRMMFEKLQESGLVEFVNQNPIFPTNTDNITMPKTTLEMRMEECLT